MSRRKRAKEEQEVVVVIKATHWPGRSLSSTSVVTLYIIILTLKTDIDASGLEWIPRGKVGDGGRTRVIECPPTENLYYTCK